MWKYFLYLIIFFIAFNTVCAQTVLKATVEKHWTIETAKEEAFKNVKYTKDLSMYDAVDPDLFENQQALKEGRINLNNRRITKFSDGDYGILFFDESSIDKGFYYDSKGNLKEVEDNLYPIKITSFAHFVSVLDKIFPFKAYIYIYIPAVN